MNRVLCRLLVGVFAGACLGGCWLTPDEVDAAKRRLENPPVPQPVPAPSPVPEPNPLECVDGSLSTGPVVGDTVGSTDDFELGCGTAGRREFGMIFEPTVGACHQFTVVADGPIDVDIGVFGSCEKADPLACGVSSIDPDVDAATYLRTVAGQPVLVVVESDQPGSWQAVALPLATIDMGANLSVQGTTFGRPDRFPHLCSVGTNTGGSYVRWVAVAAGSYQVALSGSSGFDGVLSLHRECQAEQPEVCRDEVLNGSETIDFVAAANEEITFRVASYFESRGDWTLQVTPL